MRFTKKDILDVHSLDPAEITLILDTAMGMKEISRRPVKKSAYPEGENHCAVFSGTVHPD